MTENHEVRISKEPRTVSSVFGQEIADRLAAIAIDLLCDAPERPASTPTTKVKAHLVAEGRAILDDAGIGWRDLVRARVEAEKEAAARIYAKKHPGWDGGS